MTSSSSSSLVLALLALGSATTACGAFSADSAYGEALPPRAEQASPTEATTTTPAPKAPPVGGPASTTELTDALGVFVSTQGKAGAAGTRAEPLASVQAAIDLAETVGKRVYVCAGTYPENLRIADSISVIGGLDCTRGDWRTNPAQRSRIEAPTSPAARAIDIISPTRLEGLEIVAPSAGAPSASSIGLQATRASALVVARSKIIAGDGANGTDGVEGTQLANSPTAAGERPISAAQCVAGDTCATTPLGYWLSRPAAGGTNECEGAPGHAAEAGGTGGNGGLWEVHQNVVFYFDFYRLLPTNNATPGVKNLTSAPGADAPHGANGADIGTFSAEGYTAADGQVGLDGTPGKGGNGGSGRGPAPTIDPNYRSDHGVWRGYGGAGGGAGGCPGLAGTAGTGGGASIAVTLIDSATSFEGSEIIAARGGDGGRGTFGSDPTAGGAAGFTIVFPGFEFMAGNPGGRGGTSGFSGNGGSGPSLGIAHRGLAPKLDSTVQIIPAAGGAAIDARSRTDARGVTKTIPATAAGMSKDIFVL